MYEHFFFSQRATKAYFCWTPLRHFCLHAYQPTSLFKAEMHLYWALHWTLQSLTISTHTIRFNTLHFHVLSVDCVYVFCISEQTAILDLHKIDWFLVAFAKLQKKKRLLASPYSSVRLSACLSVHPLLRLSAWNNSAPTGRIFMKFDIWVFLEKLSRKAKFH